MELRLGALHRRVCGEEEDVPPIVSMWLLPFLCL